MIEFIAEKGEPNAKLKRCYDCFYLRGAVSTWCVNKEATEWRGTSIPGVHSCKFWRPMRKKSELGWREKLWIDAIYVTCED